MILTIIALLFVHIIGDFYLQWDKFCKRKIDEPWYGRYKLFHALCIFFLSWGSTLCVCGWRLAFCIAFSHWLIDMCKAVAENIIPCVSYDDRTKKVKLKDSRFLLLSFVIDQLCHIVFIIIFSYSWSLNHGCELYRILSDNGKTILLFLLCSLIAIRPANIFISLVLNFCMIKGIRDIEPIENFRSGALIGSLERILMMIFVLIGQYEAIGFLIATKSILRFNETKSGDVRSEYVLTGTLLSVAIALLLGFLVIKKDYIFINIIQPMLMIIEKC